MAVWHLRGPRRAHHGRVSQSASPQQGQLAQDPPPLQALRDVALRPGAFFASLPRTAGIARSAAFALACIAVSTLLAWAATGFSEALAEDLAIPFVFDLVFFALYVLITHGLVALVLRGSSAGMSTTFRIVAFSQISQLVNWIPTVGLAIGLVYGSVLAVIGIQKLHDASLSRAIAIVAIPLVLAAGIGGVYLAVS